MAVARTPNARSGARPHARDDVHNDEREAWTEPRSRPDLSQDRGVRG